MCREFRRIAAYKPGVTCATTSPEASKSRKIPVHSPDNREFVLQSAEDGSPIPAPTATSLSPKRRFPNDGATIAGLPGVSVDPLRLVDSLWSGFRATSAGLAGDSPSAIWAVPQGSVVRRKCGDCRLPERARRPDNSRLCHRRILSGSRSPATESSRQHRAQRSVSPNNLLCSDQSRGMGSRRDSTVIRADWVPARIASVMSGARNA